jgi:hypothetical protein
MHLSTRWGVPSWVIRNLPAQEFIRQKLFWEAHSWGMQDDLAAMTASQLHSQRVGKRPMDVRDIKSIATSDCKFVPYIVEDPTTLRDQIFNVLQTMGKV